MDGLPIIMLTARAQESDIEQGFEAGADDSSSSRSARGSSPPGSRPF